MIAFEPAVTSIDLSIDYEMKRDLYAVLEGGWSSISFSDTNYAYDGTGIFFRGGIDHNMMELERHNDYTMGFVGFRYGFSSYKQQADHIILTDPYWGNYTTYIPEESGQAHWLEITAGIRAELWKNLFIGWSARARFMIHKTDHPSMIPYYIPGFGNPARRVITDINYSLYYRIPLMKK